MEFGRRMAIERDLEKTDTLRFSNVGNDMKCCACIDKLNGLRPI